jgi:hypothetical protein
MAMRIHDCLQKKWRDGFWFPWFKKVILCWDKYLSVSSKINKSLSEADEAPLGAMEFYQIVIAIVAVGWLSQINKPLFPLLTEGWLRFIVAWVVLYFITDFFVFLLHWAFVAERDLESARRSLATFLFDTVRIPLLFAIIFTLEDCWTSSSPLLDPVNYIRKTALQLEIAPVKNFSGCQALANYQFIISAALLTIIIASLVGTIARPSKRP